MASKVNRKYRTFILVFLPIIIVLLIALLFIIERIDRKEEIQKIATAKPGTEIEPEKIEEHVEGHIETKPVAKGTIYFVIDDVGYNLYQLEPFLQLECPMTFAILPFLSYSNEAAQQIEKTKKEYIIHIPMEALNGEDPGPGALYASMSPEVIAESAGEILRDLPGAKGANNHMGSRFTSDSESMDIVLKLLKEQGKYYLDSYTTAESVVGDVCNENDMAYKKRDIFIDNIKEPESMRIAINEGFAIAEKKGNAVLIGHVWSEALPGIIAEIYSEGKRKGFNFASLSELYRPEEASDSSRN